MYSPLRTRQTLRRSPIKLGQAPAYESKSGLIRGIGRISKFGLHHRLARFPRHNTVRRAVGSGSKRRKGTKRRRGRGAKKRRGTKRRRR